MKIKAFQCLLICLTSLLTLSGCSQAFGHSGSPQLSQVPGTPRGTTGTTSSREVERGWDMTPAPFSLSPNCLTLRNMTPCCSMSLGVQSCWCSGTADTATGVRPAPPHLGRYHRAEDPRWSGAVLPALTALSSCNGSSAPSLALC